MPFRLASLLAPLAIVAGASALPFFAVSAAEPLPLSEYGKLPDVERSAISPSGDRIALITTLNGKRVILALENQTKPIKLVTIGDMKVRSLDWVGEDRLLVTSSQTKDLSFGFTTDKAEFAQARVIPIAGDDGGKIVFGDYGKIYEAISGNYGTRKVDGKYYGFYGGIELARDRVGSRAGYTFDHGRPYLFKVDLESMRVEKIANAAREGFGNDWLVDEAGKVAFTLDISYATGVWDIRNSQGDKIADGQQPGARIGLVGLGFDGTSAIYVERGEESFKWFEISQEGGTPRPFLDDIDFEQLFFDPQTGRLMGYTIGEDETEQHVFADKTLQEKAERVREAFASFKSWISEWNSDLSDVIVRTSGNGDSGTYYAVDLETSRANALAYERLAIGPELVGPISTFQYAASDGLEMDGILTLPPGVEAKNLPVVVLPHGGPHSADTATFDWWAQAFASRGYAVFQPNFRGSTNRDSAFRQAGYGEWGRKMQTDKSDGLMALAKEGIVDPDRACIVGASYGGYAALAGVTVQQSLYRCAVAVAPVSDIRNMYQEDYRASGRDKTTRVALREQLGDPDNWNDVSPLRRAKEANAPIMLIHGKDDTVVPYSHSTKMADALKDAGKSYEMVTLDGEDHWLSLSTTRQQMLEKAVGFVERHNPPQ